jgi:AcrR family transcriptional regulator
LFEQVGFHGTTVRMSAEKAGLSPGGVFTTFEDKVAILCHIIGEHREQLFEQIQRTVPTLEGSTRDRLIRILEMAHAEEFPRLRLVAAYAGASYGWSRKLEEEHRRLHRRLADVVGGILKNGAAKGEIGDHVDLDLLLEIISSVYLRNLRTACFAGLDEAAMNARIRRQLDLILDGVRPG